MPEPNIAAAPAANVAPVVPDATPDLSGLSSDDKFLTEIFGNAEPAMGKVEQPKSTPQSEEDKARARFEYWQGQHDRVRNDYEKVLPVVQEYQQYKPVVEYLRQNPDVFDEVVKRRELGDVTPQETLREPAKPNRPANYNPEEAYNNPGSESFKYRMQYDDYTRELTEYMYAKQRMTEEHQNAMIQREREMQMQQQKVSELGKALQTQFGFQPDQVNDFVQVMNSPDSMSIENMVNLYKVIKHRSKNVVTARNSAPPTPIPPPPAFGGGGGAQETVTEEESFMRGIGAYGKRVM